MSEGGGAPPATGRAPAAGKLIVVGPGEAGKSTLISRLTADAMNLAVNGRTVSMDHGLVRHGALRISLVGMPGQARFAPVREALALGAAGAIWVHPEGEAPDPHTAALLRSAAGPPLPYVVYVNQRSGERIAPGFEPPDGLGPPRRLIRGSLVERQANLAALLDAAAELLGATSAPREEEVIG